MHRWPLSNVSGSMALFLRVIFEGHNTGKIKFHPIHPTHPMHIYALIPGSPAPLNLSLSLSYIELRGTHVGNCHLSLASCTTYV